MIVKMDKEEFNGYTFEDKNHRKMMKYLVINKGDLDINNAYAFTNKKDLNDYMKATWTNRDESVLAVFEIKDLTGAYKK